MPYDAFPWHELRYEHVLAVRSWLTSQYAPATTNRYLSALKGVIAEAWRLGLMSAEDYHRAVDFRAVKGQRLQAGRALNSGEIRSLFEKLAEDETPAGTRDAAMLAVMYGAGLRRSEVAALNVEDYDPETGALTVRSGKGDKDRLVYATNGSADALNDWLELRPRALDATHRLMVKVWDLDGPWRGPAKARPDAPLFVPIDKAGTLIERRLTNQAIYNVLQKRAAEAGVKAFSPHDLRRSMISDLLDRGADISSVQRLAGHSSVVTTQQYDRRGEATKREAAELLHIPYRRKE